MIRQPRALDRIIGTTPHFARDPRFARFRIDPADGTISEVTGHPESLIGYSRADWNEAGFWSRCIHPDDRDETAAFMMNAIGEQRSHTLEYRIMTRAGETRWVHQVVEILTEPAGEMEIWSTVFDIDETVTRDPVQHGAVLLRREVMRLASRDLAEPARTMLGYCDLLARHLAGQQDDVGMDFVTSICESIETLRSRIAALEEVAERLTDEIAESEDQG